MIKATCPACSLNYAVARGHQCPNGADQPPSPWKDRKLAYHRLYSKAYMPNWRERRRNADDPPAADDRPIRKGDAA